VERSTVVLSCLFEVSRLYGGFFTSPAQLNSYPNWRFADALSYIKYAYVGVALNELTDYEFRCTAKQISAKTCSSGNQVISQKGYDQYTIPFLGGILLLYIAGVRFIGYLGLRFVKN
jgi:hypothetical protein